jgi:hypothetical protein
VQAIYEKIESREKRYELNLYITGEDEAPAAPNDPVAVAAVHEPGGADSLPPSPEGSANQ